MFGGSSVSISYDPLGRLAGTVAGANTTQFLYDGGDLVVEYNASGSVLRRYVHGPGVDEPLVWYEGSTTATRKWLHADERGSVVAVTNSTGTVVETHTYGPYGEPSSMTGSRFQYTGQIVIPEAGLYYYKARFYAPSIGRFLQPDPIGYTDGPNLYAYVGGDPVNATDPSGLSAEGCGSRISGYSAIGCSSIYIGSSGNNSGGGGGGGGGGIDEILVKGMRPNPLLFMEVNNFGLQRTFDAISNFLQSFGDDGLRGFGAFGSGGSADGNPKPDFDSCVNTMRCPRVSVINVNNSEQSVVVYGGPQVEISIKNLQPFAAPVELKLVSLLANQSGSIITQVIARPPIFGWHIFPFANKVYIRNAGLDSFYEHTLTVNPVTNATGADILLRITVKAN